MPPKPAPVVKQVDNDAADYEKEFVEKELVISFLKTRLSRHQERGEVLLIENAKLGQELDTQKLNLADINEFLTGELAQSSAKLAQMEAEAAKQQAILDKIEQRHSDEVDQIQQAHAQVLEEQNNFIQDMEKKVKASQQFLDQKDSMDATIQQLTQTLEQERRVHQQQIADLERQHVQDKDAWKKATAAQLKEMKERMQKLSENQLETLTKRTILENEAMAAELKYQSRQVELMVAKDQAWMAEKAELKRQAQLAEQTEQELAKKSQVFQKTIQKLLSKMMEESESKKERDEEVQEMQQASLGREGEVALLQQQLAASKARSAHLQQELHASRSESRWGHDDVLHFLQTCLDDIDTELMAEDTCNDELVEMTLEQRRHALVTLLTRWQAFTESRRDKSPKKQTQGRHGDSIKAAKSLQRPSAPVPESLHTSESTTYVSSQASSSGRHGQIEVVDSVLSLEGLPAAERAWGGRIAGKNMPIASTETYLKKGTGILSSQHRTYMDLDH